jgi:hypothetical protein
MRPLYPRLTSEEADRNKHGPMWVCTYSQVAHLPCFLHLFQGSDSSWIQAFSRQKFINVVVS